MRYLRTSRTLEALAALIAAFGLSAGTARAATSVDVTYDLSDTVLWFEIVSAALIPATNDDPINGTVSGSMKVTYVSDSSSGMPILHNAVTLQTFNLTVKSFGFYKVISLGVTNYTSSILTGTFHWQLTSPVMGNLTSGGALTGLAGNVHLTGKANCLGTYSQCQQFFALPTFTVMLNYSHSGSFNLAGSPGPHGGAQSTRHTLTGEVPGIYWRRNLFGIGTGFYAVRTASYSGVQLVGREVLREAEGHDPKVTPEPGTLLLLGAGTAGLVLVGRATRCPRRT